MLSRAIIRYLIPCGISLLVAVPQASAAPRGAKTKTKQSDAKSAPAADAPAASPKDLLAQAKSLYEGLEYDRVIPLAEAVLTSDAATVDERLDAYLLQGSALAIVGDPIEAEKPFRFLLRGRPDFDMDSTTPPKILAVFRKVQVEERAIVTQLAELERDRIIRELKVDAAPLEDLVGGLPIDFRVQVRDPRGVMRTVRVLYRRQGDAQYSSLPLVGSGAGTFLGQLPGEWSENDQGFVFEYVIITQDADDRDLLVLGQEAQPLSVDVEPGTVSGAEPFYQSVWFWGLAAGTGVALVTMASAGAGAVGWTLSQPPASDIGPVHID